MNAINPEWVMAFLPAKFDPWQSRDMQPVVEGRITSGLGANAESVGSFCIVRANPARLPSGVVKLPPPLDIDDGIAVEMGSEFVYPLGDGLIARWKVHGDERARESRARRISGVLRWWTSRKGAGNG